MDEIQNRVGRINYSKLATIAVCTLLFGLLIGGLFYFYSEMQTQRDRANALNIEKNNLMTQNTDLVNKTKDLETKIESLTSLSEAMTEEAGKQAEMADVGEALTLYFAGKFDELDAILLKTDENCVSFVQWLSTNALFDVKGGIKDEANYRMGQWESVQTETNIEYANLKQQVEEYLASLQDLGHTQSGSQIY